MRPLLDLLSFDELKDLLALSDFRVLLGLQRLKERARLLCIGIDWYSMEARLALVARCLLTEGLTLWASIHPRDADQCANLLSHTQVFAMVSGGGHMAAGCNLEHLKEVAGSRGVQVDWEHVIDRFEPKVLEIAVSMAQDAFARYAGVINFCGLVATRVEMMVRAMGPEIRQCFVGAAVSPVQGSQEAVRLLQVLRENGPSAAERFVQDLEEEESTRVKEASDEQQVQEQEDARDSGTTVCSKEAAEEQLRTLCVIALMAPRDADTCALMGLEAGSLVALAPELDEAGLLEPLLRGNLSVLMVDERTEHEEDAVQRPSLVAIMGELSPADERSAAAQCDLAQIEPGEGIAKLANRTPQESRIDDEFLNKADFFNCCSRPVSVPSSSVVSSQRWSDVEVVDVERASNAQVIDEAEDSEPSLGLKGPSKFSLIHSRLAKSSDRLRLHLATHVIHAVLDAKDVANAAQQRQVLVCDPSRNEDKALRLATALQDGKDLSSVVSGDLRCVPGLLQGDEDTTRPTVVHWIDALGDPPEGVEPLEVTIENYVSIVLGGILHLPTKTVVAVARRAGFARGAAIIAGRYSILLSFDGIPKLEVPQIVLKNLALAPPEGPLSGNLLVYLSVSASNAPSPWPQRIGILTLLVAAVLAALYFVQQDIACRYCLDEVS